MHRLATVHARDNQRPTTNDQRRHDTAYLNKRLFYYSKVRRLKTRMVWLPDGEKISKISLCVLAQLTNVTDARTDGQTPGDSIYRAYAYASRGKISLCDSIHWYE